VIKDIIIYIKKHMDLPTREPSGDAK